MFAGAVRETVFASPEVIRQVNSDFVPVAARATAVEQPSQDAEGRLFQALRRSRLAPQGLAILNKDGQPLEWALMFDNNRAVRDFLKHSANRFAKHPDAKQPASIERFVRYPSQRDRDAEQEPPFPALALQHPKYSPCPGQPRFPPGTLQAQVIGRALEKNGKYSSDTLTQEHFILDQFSLPPDFQRALAQMFTNAGNHRIELPEPFGQMIASRAYLGHLDVQPIPNPVGGTPLKHNIRFTVQRSGKVGKKIVMRVEGTSELESAREAPNGPVYHHAVRLTWRGFIEAEGDRITRLLLLADGREKLKWENELLRQVTGLEPPVAFLPAGRLVNFDTAVRYGIRAEP